MAQWKFTDDYGSQYPALAASSLSLLVFSAHSLDGTTFTGTLDVAASGSTLGTVGLLTNLTAIGVAGQVTNTDGTLTVTFASTDNAAFKAGFGGTLPIVGPLIQKAGMSVSTIVTAKETFDDGPQQDDILLSMTIALGSASVDLTSTIPMHGGLFTLEGTFHNVGITLADVSKLMGKLGDGTSWFPSSQLGPYFDKGPALSLLGLQITLFVKLAPLSVQVTSVSAGIGIVGIPLLDQKLYLTPLGVWPTVQDPAGSPQVVWSIVGGLALCSYTRPGNYEQPDLSLELAMDLTSFAVSAELENPNNVSINTVIQDLLGQGTSIGLPTELTVNAMGIEASTDKTTGKLDSFAANVTMSGGFGLFKNLDIEEISIAVAYSA